MPTTATPFTDSLQALIGMNPAPPAEEPSVTVSNAHGITIVAHQGGFLDPLNQQYTVGAKWQGSDGKQYGAWFFSSAECFSNHVSLMRGSLAHQLRQESEEALAKGETSPYLLDDMVTPRAIATPEL